ncbi:MAG: hypothetical protein HC880_14475 [Bacteroidia bacterium]|nr:hypothetical protein [Bacteroidia bacterium]
MRKASDEEKKIASEIKFLDGRLRNAQSPHEVEALEKEMAELMHRLLRQMRNGRRKPY